MVWYDLIRSIMKIYYSFSIYKDCSLYTACSSSCFRILRDYHFPYMIRNIYCFLYITSNVSKGQYLIDITLSKRYNGRRSLNLPTRGLFALMPAPYLNVHLSNKGTFIIYILHFMFCYGIPFFLI